MDSYDQTTTFHYNPTQDPETSQFSGILEIYVHHATNIHNICIYENQDVYAKFSLTYNPDKTFSTRVINGGGKNPEFNEKLVIKINQPDAVLKCELWMLSRAKSFMEDQLLGFSLVQISSIFGKRELTREFSLSSTDLFHSPAGTVKLSLSLNTNLPFDDTIGSTTGSSITSEVVLLDPLRVEFPDLDVVRENQQMVSEYFGLSGGSGSDYEMVANSGSISTNDSKQNSGFFSSTMTSLSDDRNSADSTTTANEPNPVRDGVWGRWDVDSLTYTESRKTDSRKTSGKRKGENTRNSADSLDKKNSLVGESSNSSNVESSGFNENTFREKKEVKEETEMQQQIVDMYMKSMQQFTDSLAKMKLPINLEKTETEDRGDVIQRPENNLEIESKKKDGGRIFYGSRAFF